MNLSEQEARDCLIYGPFDCDRDGGETLLSDVVRRSAKFRAGECHDCGGDIAKGEQHRARTEAYDGKVMTFRFCLLCCKAQALSWKDDGEAVERRIAARGSA